MKTMNYTLASLLISFGVWDLGIFSTHTSTEKSSKTFDYNSKKIVLEDTVIETVETRSLIDTTSVKPAMVNYDFFEELVAEVKTHRAQRLVNLDTFLIKSKMPTTVILDTRSKEMYDLKHVKGAIHLNFSDFTQQALDNMMNLYNGKNTQILIYCNNNFFDSKAINNLFMDNAFVFKSIQPTPKIVQKGLVFEMEWSFNSYNNDSENTFDNSKTMALNIPTYINLYGYGYRNVYELQEFVDVNDLRIEFEGTYLEKAEDQKSY